MIESTATHNECAFLGASDLELYRQSWRPAGAARARIIVVHGYAEHSGRYAWAGERLADAGYAVHAFDQRGHGQSVGARVLVDSFREHLDDLKAFVAEVETESDGSPLFVFGHSMGGAIVTLYIAVRSNPFAGVILSGPAIAAPRGLRLAGPILGVVGRLAGPILGVVGRIAPGLGLVRLSASSVSRSLEIVEEYRSDPLVYRGKMPAGTVAAYGRALARIHAGMERIELPLLLLHGTADELCSPRGSKLLHERAGSLDKTLKLYDGFAHELLNEPEKEQVLADILAWLDARMQG